MKSTALDIETREMTVHDLDDVLVIERASFPIPWSENIFLGEIETPFCHSLVALAKGSVVGYICFAIVCDEIHLRNIAVHHQWKRRGVASVLLSRMVALSSSEKARYGTLEVRKSNTPALNLYKKFGFVVEGIRPAYYSETREDALIMWADFGL